MTRHIVGGHGRSRQYECAVILRINSGSHLVPHGRSKLPLINEARTSTVEKAGGIQLGKLQGCGIGVQLDAAIGMLTAGGRFSACPRSLEHDSSRVRQCRRKLSVDDP